MNVAIIGAGVAGTLAAGALSRFKPTNFDAKSKDVETHSAVMRLRDPNVARYLGTTAKEINVWKAVSFDDRLFEVADIRMNNLYSRKLYGSYGERSLSTLGRVKRYLIDDLSQPSSTVYDAHLVGVERGKLTFQRFGDEKLTYDAEYDVCISTIPLEVMLSVTNIKHDLEFVHSPIWVYTNHLKENIGSCVHQTIYFPDCGTDVYRATLQGQKMIVECIRPLDYHTEYGLDDNLAAACNEFGLSLDDFGSKEWLATEQKMGKMGVIDEDQRKRVIYELTDKYNIFSLGRYAIWKPIRTDHLIKDIEKIQQLMRITNIGYERNIIHMEP